MENNPKLRVFYQVLSNQPILEIKSKGSKKNEEQNKNKIKQQIVPKGLDNVSDFVKKKYISSFHQKYYFHQKWKTKQKQK